MPKTLKDIGIDVTPEFNPRAFLKDPKLAALVMQVIGNWAVIEALLAQILTVAAKAEYAMVAGMLSALNSSQAQRDATIAGLEAELTDDDFRLLKAVLATTSDSQRRRNQFAHHLWGSCPQLPSQLLLQDPRNLGVALVELLRAYQAGQPKTPLVNPSKVLVFDEADLTKEVNASMRAAHLVLTCGFLALHPVGTALGDAKRDELRRDHEIAQLLQSQSRQKRPQERQQ